MINGMTAQIGTQLDDDLALSLGLATEAGALGLAHFVAGVMAETKADASPVSVADREVEHLLRRQLAALRPADSILGEEFGLSGNAARTWILDPIDGTNFFVERDPNWRVQIALQVNDEIVLAAVDEPANGRRWWASIGGGTWEQTGDGEPRRHSTALQRCAARIWNGEAVCERSDARSAHPFTPMPPSEWRNVPVVPRARSDAR